ncbi:2-aminoadipate transaminase [compost metagenome]
MESVRLRLAEAMDRTVARLQAIGIKPWITPQSGMYVWCQLPQGKDAATLARACLNEGVVLAPGNAFSQSMAAGDFLRFNVAQSGDAKIYEVLKRALSA